MSYGGGQSGYDQYGGNPYSQESGGYASQNRYGDAPASNLQAPPSLGHEMTNISQGSNYSQPGAQGTAPASHTLALQDFLARVDLTRQSIRDLSSNISQISTLHQRSLANPDASSSASLEHMVSQTQILNTQIRDQIKFLEVDALKSQGSNRTTKQTQSGNLKRTFDDALKEYQKEEVGYRQRYREQIARQYQIVNPEASPAEIEEASNADWGDEGVFQTALKTNRTGAATSVLGAVRARHNEIQRIEQTLAELAQLFNDMAAQVELQEPAVERADEQVQQTVQDIEQGDKQLDIGIEHARRRNRLKWWCLLICILIIAIIALILGLGFGVGNWGKK